MKSKRISVIIVAAIFLLVAVGCLVGLFTTKKVQVDYAVSDEIKSEQIQSVLDSFLGDNLLFLKAEDVNGQLKNFTYVEVVSVKKDFPNILSVKLRERREVYYLAYSGGYLVTTENGFVLRTATQAEVSDNLSRDKIILDLNGVNILEASVGSVVKTDDDLLLSIVFNMAKSVQLTDCIKSIELFKPNVPGANVTFYTYTGVAVEIAKVENKGVEMAEQAFKSYDSAESDYIKTFSTIKVNLVGDRINVVWTGSR